MAQEQNWTVTGTFEVRAESEDAAIKQITDAVRGNWNIGPNLVSPVATFKVRAGAQLLDRVTEP